MTIEVRVLEDSAADERLFLESEVFEGTIDANGRIVAERIDDGESFITVCDDGGYGIDSAPGRQGA